jgi:hypothetical protein
MLKKIILASLALLIASRLSASPIDWMTYQGPAVGARAAGLSGSIMAEDNDPNLAFWNPAGLANIKWSMVSCSYLHSMGLLFDPVFSGPKRLSYLVFAGRGIGLSWRSLARYAESRLVVQGGDSVDSYLKYGVDEFAFAFAKKDELHPSMSLGLSAKLITARMTEVKQIRADTLWSRAGVIDENGTGYGLDLGFHGGREPLMIGINVQNLVGKVYWKDFDDDKLKPKISGGISWFNGKLPKITAGAEKFWGKGVPELKYMAGGEYKHDMPGYGAVTFRAGASQYRKAPDGEYDWSLGLGYIYKSILVDVAGMDQQSSVDGTRQKNYMASLSLFLE